MNTVQLLNVLQRDPLTKSVITRVLPSDRLPDTVSEKPRGFIGKVDTSVSPGTPWVAIYLTRDGGEFRASYRQQPSHCSENLETFLKNNSSTFTYNRYVLQLQWSSVGGQYSLFYALHRCRNIPLSTIINTFANNKE